MSKDLTDRLEAWLNIDPELRWAEFLVGQNYRWCVRLWEIAFDERGTVKRAEFEAGTMAEALIGALNFDAAPGDAV